MFKTLTFSISYRTLYFPANNIYLIINVRVCVFIVLLCDQLTHTVPQVCFCAGYSPHCVRGTLRC